MRSAALIFLLGLSSFVPGFVVVRRLHWRPRETLCASVALSLALVYLGTFALYLSGLPMSWCGAGSMAAGAMAIAYRRDLARHLRAVWPVLAGFAFLLAWTLSFVAVVRHFSGGGWGVDWLEHFQRCLLFLHRLPVETVLHGNYHLTARPPFMNVVGAYFLAHVGDEFASFQIVFAFLNVLPFLAACLIARRLWTRRAVAIPVLAVLFAVNPLFVQNVTYTWTKLLSAFFVMVAVDFYLSARRRPARGRDVVWPVAFAGAILVHYSAIPFAIVVVGHHLLALLRSEAPRRWAVRLLPALPGVLLLATWAVWAFLTYGMSTSLTSNTSFGDAQRLSAFGNVLKVGQNVIDTLIPHPLRGIGPETFAQPSRAGRLRDYFFLIFQTNVIAAVGSVAGLLAIALLAWRFGARAAPAETRFWRMFVPLVVLLGVATHGARDVFGVAHVTLQPLVLLGVTLVAAAWRTLPRAARYAVLAGVLIDFGLGIALQHHVESLENTPARQVFSPHAAVVDGGLEWKREGELSRSAWYGWYSKQASPLLEAQLQRARQLPAARARRVVDAVQPELARQRRIDASAWGGWYARHGGRITLVGDRMAGGAEAIGLLIVAAFVGIVVVLARAAKH